MDKFFIINVRNELKKREFLWDTQNNAYMNKEANKNGWLEISKIVNCDARLIERFSIYMKLDLFFNKHVFVDVGKFNYRTTLRIGLRIHIETLQKCDSYNNSICWMKFHYNTVDHILKTNNLEFFKFSTVKFYDSLTLREEIACYIEASANNYIKDNECSTSPVEKEDIKKFSDTINEIVNSPLKGIVNIQPPLEVPDTNHMMLRPYCPPTLPDKWLTTATKLIDHIEYADHFKMTNTDCESPVINVQIENTTGITVE